MRSGLVFGIALTLAAATAAACGGSGDDGADDTGDDSGDDSGDDGGDDAPCDPEDIVAWVRVSPEPGASGPRGSQAEAQVLATRPIQLEAPTDTVDGCAFYGPSPALCEPACTGGELCDIHGECLPYDEPIAAGTITISGTTPVVALEPTQFNTYYSQENLPGLFGPSDPLTVDIEGEGELAGFQIQTLGIPVLELPTTNLTAVETVGLTMSWTPTDVDGAEFVLHMDNDHHAGPESVECVVPASAGTLTVPPAILDQLILAGEAGIGTYIENAWVQLRRRGTIETARGCATFDADSADFVSVETIRD